MKCPVCHAEAATGSAFCSHCGAKLPLVEAAGKGTTGGDSTNPSASQSAASTAASGSGGLGGRRRVMADVPEEVLWEGHYSIKAMIGPAALAALASGGLVAVGVLWGYWPAPVIVMLAMWLLVLALFAWRRLGIRYKMTNQMFYHKQGVFTRTTDRIEAIDIDDVTWRQNLIERLVNVGNVKISSRDRSDPTFWLTGIENAEQVAHMIDKARRAERMRRGFLTVEQTNVDAGT